MDIFLSAGANGGHLQTYLFSHGSPSGNSGRKGGKEEEGSERAPRLHVQGYVLIFHLHLPVVVVWQKQASGISRWKEKESSHHSLPFDFKVIGGKRFVTSEPFGHM